MSRLTSAQIISLGEYLNPDFEPSSLTISQLLGVLGFHNIKYPSPYTKPKLVQLFNDEIKSKAPKLKKERLKKESSIASDDGIIDGVTGKAIGGEQSAPVRRSSRRLSRAPSEDQSTSSIRPEPPKRRRSSAQPTLGGPSRTIGPVEPALVEQSEPEEEEFPMRKVGRSKKTSEDAGSQSRRVSGVHEDSGWEDNNIFQSGAESSSPARPSPVRPKAARKTAPPRKSRKASSAPPQLSPPSSPARPFDIRHSPPQSKFEPELSSHIFREPRRTSVAKAKRTSFTPIDHEPVKEDSDFYKEEELIHDDELNLVDESSGLNDADEMSAEISGQEVLQEEEDEDKDHAIAVSRRIAEGGKGVIRHSHSNSSNSTPLWLRVIYSLLFLATSSGIISYKLESRSIGFCDTGSNTNNALEELKASYAAIEACNFENRTLLHPMSLSGTAQDETPCPPLALIPLPHPTTCTPCPDHATCSQHGVTCDNGYLLHSHPLLGLLTAHQNTSFSVPITFNVSSPGVAIWKVISEVADGLPALGPVAFPPRCIEDPKRKRNIGVLGKAMESMLGQLRGQKVCRAKSVDIVSDGDGGEAKRWGVASEDLRDAMKKKTPSHLLPTFDDTFNEAMQQLVQWGGVIIGEDAQGKRYVAHKTADLTWDCALTVKSREVWAEWRNTVIGVALSIAGVYLAKAQAANRRVENRRVAELVQIALDTLRNQELAHHTDPVTAPQPYLSSLQLRDLILQDEHSIPTRRRLWDKVEHVVEGNANVRANLEEVHGGDELRVWRWVGSAGRGPGTRKRVQFEERGEEAAGLVA